MTNKELNKVQSEVKKSSEKTLTGSDGEFTIDVPRDRNGDFEPKIIQKNQTRFEGFDQKIITLYARGISRT